jgi:hypothetical protein
VSHGTASTKRHTYRNCIHSNQYKDHGFVFSCTLKMNKLQIPPWAIVDPIPPRMEPPPLWAGAGGGAWCAAKRIFCCHIGKEMQDKLKLLSNASWNAMNSIPMKSTIYLYKSDKKSCNAYIISKTHVNHATKTSNWNRMQV